MSNDLELERSDSYCAPNYQLRLLLALEDNNYDKFKKILVNAETRKNVDVNYFNDHIPYYHTLIGIASQQTGKSKFISLLLGCGADPNKKGIENTAPLHIAIENGDLPTIRELLACQKTDFNIVDDFGNTPLHLAVRDEKLEIVESLLNYSGIEANSINRKGKTPISLAAQGKNRNIIREILKKCPIDLDQIDTSSELSYRALILRNFPEMEYELKCVKKPVIENVNPEQLFIHLRNNNGRMFWDTFNRIPQNGKIINMNDGKFTFLEYACYTGQYDFVKQLLEKGADVNASGPGASGYYKTPLMIAGYHGYIKIVKFLVDTKKVSYEAIDEKTVLHAILDGMMEEVKRNANISEECDHIKCLEYVLKNPESNSTFLDINYQDSKGNAALHFAVKIGEKEIVTLLLRNGAYVGLKNTLGEEAFAGISKEVLEEYLDECVKSNGKLPSDEGYEIIFDYGFLSLKSYIKNAKYETRTNAVTMETNDQYPINGSKESSHNCVNQPVYETAPLLSISQSPELRCLIKHPVLMSFLNLKWYSIKRYFYVNLTIYLLFWLFLTIYVLQVYCYLDPVTLRFGNRTENRVVSTSKSDPSGFHVEYILWILLACSCLVISIREFFQLLVSPRRYFFSAENWLEFSMLVGTYIILFASSVEEGMKQQIGAIVILLSWMELVLLIGRHPLLSTNIEMFLTVTCNFLKFLSWYSLLLIGFALSFYILFRNTENEPDSNFANPWTSLFKSLIMLTGEFDASNIPFSVYPGISHVVFALFIFLIAMVLFNLLNGLAVSDTQRIKLDAEIVGCVSRAKLITYFETMAYSDPVPLRKTVEGNTCACCCCCIPYKQTSRIKYRYFEAFYRRINVFPHLHPNKEISVLANQNNAIVTFRKARTHRNDCGLCSYCADLRMANSIMKAAKRVLNKNQKAEAENKQKHETMTLLNDVRNKLDTLNNVLHRLSSNKEI